MDISGPAGMLWSPDGAVAGRSTWRPPFWPTASSIYGGTDQIQRNVIGERTLGLPRDVSPDRYQSFAETLASRPLESRSR